MAGQHLYSSSTGERLYLNPEERDLFLAATRLEETNVKYFCQMLFYTGAQLNEVIGITFESIDLEKKGVVIGTLMQRRKDVFRFIDLPTDFIEVLNDVYQIKKKQTDEKLGREPVWDFTGRTGENYVKKVMMAAGITGKKANARGLRHSFGMAAAESRIPSHQIQQWLGHRNPSGTAAYTRVIETERRNLAEKLWKKV